MILLNGHTDTVATLAFSPDGTTLASAGKDGTVRIWTMSSNRVLSLDHTRPVRSLAFVPDGSAILTGGEDGAVFLSSTTPSASSPNALPTRLNQTSEQAVITGLHVFDFDPWMSVVATGGGTGRPQSGEVRGSDWNNLGRVRLLETDPDGVTTIACLSHPRLIAWATGNRQVAVRDLTRPDPIRFPQANRVDGLALSPDGEQLAVASDRQVKLYHLNRRQLRLKLSGHKGIISAVAFHPSGRLLYSGSWDGTVRCWDAQTGEERGLFEWPTGGVFTLVIAPDGLRAAAAGRNGTICMWDIDET